jgi:hypothetical protein
MIIYLIQNLISKKLIKYLIFYLLEHKLTIKLIKLLNQ